MNTTQELTQLVASLSAEQLQSKAGKALTRRLVRTSYEAWCRFALAPQQQTPALHHKLIIDHIEMVLRGEIKNLMMLMPRGSAKSTYSSILLPPYYLNPEKFPLNLILACSYSYTLIEGFGRQCRDIIDKHGDILGYGLSKSAAAAGDWRTTRGGGYFCAGVGSGIAGHRADLGLIDDYIGSQEEADSQLIRDKQWSWYYSDFWPCLKPNASQIIIANRRHEDDLIGRLLNKEGSKWTVIRLPMLAEDNDPLGRKVGERLWGDWFTDDMVQKAKTQPRIWAGMYQQRPAPEEGNYFHKDSIVEYRPDDLPKDLRMYVGADYAVRRGEDNDRFCFLPAGMDNNGRLWILPDWFWCQSDAGEAVERMLELARRRKPICWWSGRENITGSIAPFLNKRMHETNTYIPIEELSESRDKESKAQSIKARMSAKMVMFPSFAPGWEDALHELLTFPGGTHDDFVDALAKLGQGLAKMTPASLTKPQWNGILEHERLTCGWLRKSVARRERSDRLALQDN